MPRTVTIEVPDAFLPDLDRVIARWIKAGKPADVTLWNMLRHGIRKMDTPDWSNAGPPPPGSDAWNPERDAPGEDIPF